MAFNVTSEKQKKNYFLAFVSLLYVCRLLYMYLGYLKNYQWLGNGDESHVYLLGLKFFTDGNYPYLGPDIVSTSSYLVGGMQGLLVGLPLFIWSHPFSPYLFLFVILSISMIYLSWYLSKLFPNMPRWLIYEIIALSPFTIHTGLKIINPAYVLCFAIPFMLSLIEIFKLFSIQYIGPRWRYFWMGLAALAVFQIHASWVFLFILWGLAMAYTFLQRKNIGHILPLFISSILGLVVGSLSLLPSLYHYGMSILFQQGGNLNFSIKNITDIGAILFYFILSSGYEMGFFDYNWNVLLDKSLLYAILFGVLQIVGLVLLGFQIIFPFWIKWRSYVIAFKHMLFFNVVVIFLLSGVYLFSLIRPNNYAIICIYPLSAIYLCWFLQGLVFTTKIKYAYFGMFLGLLICYYTVVVCVSGQLPNLGYRDKAFKAIEKKDATLFETYRFPHP